jgi:hypothetical protein
MRKIHQDFNNLNYIKASEQNYKEEGNFGRLANINIANV